MSQSPALPMFPESYWIRSTADVPTFPGIEHDLQTGVVVIGGGISGITTAWLLRKAGLDVVLLEAGKLFHGTTGHTTAKVTAQHDLIYDELIRQHGEEKAAQYYKANEDALQFMRTTIEERGIACGWLDQDAYIFTHSTDEIEKLQKEWAAYEKLGIPGFIADQTPLDFAVKAALRMDRQAQFHPLHYLMGLVRAFTEAGGHIYEQTTARDIEEGEQLQVITADERKISCRHVAICSHFPFYDGHGFFFARMHAERSYVLGVKSEFDYPGGMYISAGEPKRSIRSATTEDGSKLLLIGGQNHKTGQGIPTIRHYEALQQYAAQQFNAQQIVWRWSAQDLITGDKIPYIGRMTASTPHIYIATGYKKWGMTSGTAAAMLISDLIQEKSNPYEELFSPSRSLSAKTLKTLVMDNFDVAKHLVGGKLEMIFRKPDELDHDEGSVVAVHGRRAGAYKDPQGKLHVVDTTCTHMGCEVEWNDGERTWDCPCHGSRFSYTGEVLEGPAQNPLKPVTFP